MEKGWGIEESVYNGTGFQRQPWMLTLFHPILSHCVGSAILVETSDRCIQGDICVNNYDITILKLP